MKPTNQQQVALDNCAGIYGVRGLMVPNWLRARILATPDDNSSFNPYCVGWVQSK